MTTITPSPSGTGEIQEMGSNRPTLQRFEDRLFNANMGTTQAISLFLHRLRNLKPEELSALSIHDVDAIEADLNARFNTIFSSPDAATPEEFNERLGNAFMHVHPDTLYALSQIKSPETPDQLPFSEVLRGLLILPGLR